MTWQHDRSSSRAIAKARRVGIGLIGALRMGDSRVKYQIRDTVFTRKVTVPGDTTRFSAGLAPGFQLQRNFDILNLSVNGRLVLNWIVTRIRLLVLVNPVVNGTILCDHILAKPLMIDSPDGLIPVVRLSLNFAITGAWYRHDATIDASNGYYDWVRKRPRMAPGRQTGFIRIPDIHGGVRVERPPGYILNPSPLIPGEVKMPNLIKIHAAMPTGPAPDIDNYLEPEDRQLVLRGLEEAAYTSTLGFVPQP